MWSPDSNTTHISKKHFQISQQAYKIPNVTSSIKILSMFLYQVSRKEGNWHCFSPSIVLLKHMHIVGHLKLISYSNQWLQRNNWTTTFQRRVHAPWRSKMPLLLLGLLATFRFRTPILLWYLYCNDWESVVNFHRIMIVSERFLSNYPFVSGLTRMVAKLINNCIFS